MPPRCLSLRRLCAGAAFFAATFSVQAQNLEDGFRNPPQEARPRTWWHWLSGNVSKEGITTDLEAMKRVGLSGAQLFNAKGYNPGPVKIFSDEWRQLILHAVREADRLGLELGVHNCAGWSESGGPWVKPEESMQFVYTATAFVKGGQKVQVSLPTDHPAPKDIAVWAFPTLAGDAPDATPKLSASPGVKDLEKALGTEGKAMTVFPASADSPRFLQLEYPQAMTAGSVEFESPSPAITGDVQVSDDGSTFRTVGKFRGYDRVIGGTFAPEAGRIWRMLFTSKNSDLRIQKVSLGGVRLADAELKAAGAPGWQSRVPTQWQIPAEGTIDPKVMANLSDLLAPDGTLTWNAPAGNWTIIRFYHASNGRKNGPADKEGEGLECDKLSREAVTAHLKNGLLGMVVADAGPLAGKALTEILADSWEAGFLNWTPAMRAEFQKRRGYDPVPWLPTLTGRVVGSAEQSERFLWDFRRVIADLIAENHYAVFKEFANQHGMKFYAEAPGIGGPTTGDQVQCKRQADIPMGEFWYGGDGGFNDLKEAASAAHLNGTRWAAAESFTSHPRSAAWRNAPYDLKALGDRVFCRGINRFVFHRYAHQPVPDKYPGIAMGPWGINFERTQTWWEQGRAWIDYISRCQWLLSQGKFVADICYFYGEHVPVSLGDPPKWTGYDFDACDAEALQKMEVRDGRLISPGGTSYAVLHLFRTDQMTLKTLVKIRDLVQAGATVIGDAPKGSPSLQDYPNGDLEVKRIAEELWGAGAAPAADSQVGKGRVFSNGDIPKILSKIGVQPDFSVALPQGDSAPEVMSIHRQTPDADIYFVSSQAFTPVETEGTFRVTGRVPELWRPDTGKIEIAPVYRQADGRTTVPLRFDACGSVFVVFRKAASPDDRIVSFQCTDSKDRQALQIQRASYNAMFDPSISVDATAKITELAKSGATDLLVRTNEPAVNMPKVLTVEYTLDGKPMRAVVPEFFWLHLGEEMRNASLFNLSQPVADPAILTRWSGGTFTATFASGKQWQRTFPELPPPAELPGPWKLSFPPKWGAPAQITMEKLVSWADHPDEGVKYFSGTATYEKEFQVNPEQLAPGKTLRLNLGEVKNLAEVTVNGRDLGILWKPPFSVDLTGIAKPGSNTLQVKVTNLWPNRMIGDQKLPPEQRFTWTTYEPFKADSPLFPSGLLGPVTLQTGETAPVVP